MPFENEVATGESLLALEKSEALRNFEGGIAVRDDASPRDPPPVVGVPRNGWLPRRVVAIDGSNLTHKVRNGFPGAEVTLVLMAVVFIDVTRLAAIRPDEIPSPRVFNEMDDVETLDAVLPGANVVRRDRSGDSPKRFFRASVFDILAGRIDPRHETLLDTLRAITTTRPRPQIACPADGCERGFTAGAGAYVCDCPRGEPLWETDALRFHERFNELGSNGEVHGEVRHVLEVLSLVNLLRYFEPDDRIHFLRDCAFVLDGPLAVFGQPAALLPYVRDEIIRISAKARACNGVGLLVMGVEKTGQYVNHFADLDWTDEDGPRSRFAPGTALVPGDAYVRRNITFAPTDAKQFGKSTYFGRKVLYKTQSSAHAVLNLAMVNDQGRDFDNTTAEAFPRLGDALNILDHLSTYLYQDGLMPLVRAHAHAAIPLRRGTDILAGLFGKA